MSGTHTLPFIVFWTSLLTLITSKMGRNPAFLGCSGNDRFTNTNSPVKNLVSTTLKD